LKQKVKALTPEEKINYLPAKPGVYYFKDGSGEIIYVGKAISLKNRVRSYYREGAQQTVKVRSLTARAADLEYIVTDNEIEALILESNLIKEHRPRYNVVLKDDKSYPYIKVTLAENFPRVYITRRLVKDDSRYFGPYTEVGAVHETLNLLRGLFHFRTCKKKIDTCAGGGGDEEKGTEGLNKDVNKNGPRPCLNYHIKRCLAPCCGMIDQQTYRTMIYEICLFLEGRQEELLKQLNLRMNQAAAELQYEQAARIRDQIEAIKKVIAKQKIISTGRQDRDVVAVARGNGIACVVVFFMRTGKLIGREPFFLPNTDDMSDAEVVTAFLKQYYNGADFIPREILVSSITEDKKEIITKWLTQKRGNIVKVHAPVRGEKKKIIDMAAENAFLFLKEEILERQGHHDLEKTLTELAKVVGLDKIPKRLECYDVSNTQGTENAASMVVFEKGRLCPEQYRRFKIRTVEGPNDYACLREALGRRFARAREESELIKSGLISTKEAGFNCLPDIVLVDGGKGQLSVVREVMAEAGYAQIPVCGLAKEEESLFLEGEDGPLRLPENSPVLHLLQKLRDEAHRFALGYHRKLRAKRSLKSILDEIDKVGPVRRRELLKSFSSLEAIRQASVEELRKVKGMNRLAAQAVYSYFHD
jgi:excinuclease ABC subunit C